MTTGQGLKKVRNKYGVSRDAARRRMKKPVTNRHWRRWEDGTTDTIPFDAVKALAKAAKIDLFECLVVMGFKSRYKEAQAIIEKIAARKP